MKQVQSVLQMLKDHGAIYDFIIDGDTVGVQKTEGINEHWFLRFDEQVDAKTDHRYVSNMQLTGGPEFEPESHRLFRRATVELNYRLMGSLNELNGPELPASELAAVGRQLF